MNSAERFFDTNILLYLFSSDEDKANLAEELLSDGATISVQVLNEFAAVATRKLHMSIADVREALVSITAVCRIVPLTLDVHEQGLRIAERYGFSIYDALIVSAALEAECNTLVTEDLQHGQLIGQRLTVINPFLS
ncbi:MAG: PIN domain-containing protein [Burkholderiaceae bacterium]